MKKLISIEGASSNNLKKISCQIPWYSLCVITGLSGSGKSSLAIDTIQLTLSIQRAEEDILNLSPHMRDNFLKKLKSQKLSL